MRFERSRPGELVHIDVKKLGRIQGGAGKRVRDGLRQHYNATVLDFNNAIVVEGFRIPALASRRAETEVELRDGQTFAIAGMIDQNLNETLRRVPGLGGRVVGAARARAGTGGDDRRGRHTGAAVPATERHDHDR